MKNLNLPNFAPPQNKLYVLIKNITVYLFSNWESVRKKYHISWTNFNPDLSQNLFLLKPFCLRSNYFWFCKDFFSKNKQGPLTDSLKIRLWTCFWCLRNLHFRYRLASVEFGHYCMENLKIFGWYYHVFEQTIATNINVVCLVNLNHFNRSNKKNKTKIHSPIK